MQKEVLHTGDNEGCMINVVQMVKLDYVKPLYHLSRLLHGYLLYNTWGPLIKSPSSIGLLVL